MREHNEEVAMAIITLEEMGLVDYDEEESTFSPTTKGMEIVDGEARWLIELKKLHKKKHPNEGEVIVKSEWS